MAHHRWLIYGAYGFTGQLIAEEAQRRGMQPVLAGRRAEAVQELADRLDLEGRVFDLGSPEAVARQIQDFEAVLLAAGPFSQTSAPVVEACLRTGAHYLDITGEIGVFEAIFRLDGQARERGVVLLPGVGFDVVPTDCLAAVLKQALPSATRLDLAFVGLSSSSKGTVKTMVEGLPHGGAIRRNGTITTVPPAFDVKEIPFPSKPRMAMTIPWGDVSTAYHSTGIPNIRVYMAVPPRLVQGAKLSRPFQKLLGTPPVQHALKRWVDKNIEGPDAHTRAVGRSEVWGRASDDTGRRVEGTLTTPEGYRLTAMTAVEAVRRLLDEPGRRGAFTPSGAFGARFITEFEGCDLQVGPVEEGTA
ncbi:MAG: saccharopine dehydrogenase family protein [Myxococcota bacterium]